MTAFSNDVHANPYKRKLNFLTGFVWFTSLTTAVLGVMFSFTDIKLPGTRPDLTPFHEVSLITTFLCGCCIWWGIRMKRRALFSEQALETYRRYNTQYEDGMAIWFCDNMLISATYDVKTIFSLRRGLTLENSLEAICSKFNTDDAENLRSNIIHLQNEGRAFRLWLPMFDKSVVIVSGRPEGASFVIRFVNATEEAQEVAQLAARTEITSFEYQKMLQILDVSPIYQWRRAQSLRLNWVNESYAKALGIDARDVILEQRELTLGQLGSKNSIELARRAYNTGTIQNEQRQVVFGDKKKVLDVFETPCGDGTIGYAIDVTEKVEIEKSLDQAKLEYLNTIDQLNTGVALFDKMRCLQFYNKAVAKLLQLDTDWLSQKPDHFEVIDRLRQRRRLPEWSDFKDWRQSLTDLYTGNKKAQDETWHLPDGTIFNVRYKVRPTGGVLILFEDVTDKITLERQYNTLLGLRKATFEQLSEGLVVFGMDGYAQFANISFSRIWNIDPERLETRPHITEVIEWCKPIYSDPQDWADIQSIVTTSGVRGRWHELIACRDGRTLDASVRPLPDGSMLVAFRDVTDEQKIETALLEKASALEAADNLKTEFMSHISYQLRTPLNTILGFGEILQREMYGTLNEQQQEYVMGILNSSSSLLRSVNDILDLSSIQAGTFSLDIGQIDMFRLLSSLSNLLMVRVESKKIKFKLDCPKNIGLIPGDENRLRQAIFRLIQNAVKHTSSGDKIEVGCKRENDKIVLWVKDTGKGMSKEQLNTVFETFNGIKRLGRNNDTGIGIGLTLVKKFIELHDGTISIDSELNKGTKVYCTLPAVQMGGNTLDAFPNYLAK